VLKFLEQKYNLVDGNLLDVHSLFYLFNEKNWGFEEIPKQVTYNGSLYTLIMEKQNIIAYGPPGTGKTREAFNFAIWWRNKFGTDTVYSITFHPSYSYEEFIEGYRPSGDGSGFKLRSGIFKQICEKAINNSDKNFLLIIDEINRGDIARIFGELITLIEKDKRGNSYLTILPGSGESFYVPANLFIFGTMNTADKSISLMDLAIRRRFLFYPFNPDPEVLNEGRIFINKVGPVSLSGLLIGINQRLIDIGIDKDRILGHSYFLIDKGEKQPIEMLKNRFRFEIIPLIEEYCYADRGLMKNVLGELVDDMGYLNSDLWDDSEKFMDLLKAIDAE
jgi:5-methylcytosine-specific restriction protein B